MNAKQQAWLLIIVLIIATIIVAFIAFNNKAGANFTPPLCNEDHKYNCIIPTPTKDPCKKWEDDEENCITPTTKPTPVASPTASPTPSVASPSASTGSGNGNSGSNNPPPVAQCNTPFAQPLIVNFTNKGKGTVNFAWTEGQIVDKYSITYGYTPNNLNMGEDNIPGNVLNWDIHELNPGSHVWAQIQAWFRGCEESSNIFDPKVL